MRVGKVLMALLYAGAGVLHFAKTPVYVAIMPEYLPHPRALVLVSGAAEIAGGVGLLVPATSEAAAWGLIALLVAVMPANVNMAVHAARWPGIPAWMLWARLPLQVPLIAWAWIYTRNKRVSG